MEKELNISSDKIKKALEFATKCHAGVFRKSGDDRPYISHPVQVATFIQTYHPENENAIIGALLHDTVEDCEDVTSSTIEENFGEEVANIVKDVTDDESDLPDLPKDELKRVRRQRQVDNLKNICSEAKLIRLGDKISNTIDIVEVNDFEWRKNYLEFMKACYEELRDIDSPMVAVLKERLEQTEKDVYDGSVK